MFDLTLSLLLFLKQNIGYKTFFRPYVTGCDILSLTEPKIGNFVFHTFMYISVFTADFQKDKFEK